MTLDTLVYGNDSGRILNLYERHTAFARLKTKRNRVDRPEMDDEDKEDEEELRNILQAVKQEQERRRKAMRASRKQEDTEDEDEVSIAWNDGKLASLGIAARESGMPLVCLTGSRHADADMLAEWRRFCHKARERIQFRHREQGDEIGLLCVTPDAQYLQLDVDWTGYYLSDGNLQELEILLLMDRCRELQSISDLPDEAIALVYDVECPRSQQAMREWRCSPQHFVIPMLRTGFPYGCVVTRRNEMYEIVKI